MSESGRCPMEARSVHEARRYFPRGLLQPEGSFRFSLDALLLASFAAQGTWSRALDLGTGCGVVGLALLLRTAEQGGAGINNSVLGLEREPELVAAATDNARRLGLEAQFRAVCADLREMGPEKGREWAENAPANSFDLVLANPPYRDKCAGRMNPEQLRRNARFETQAGLEVFVQAARGALKTKGRLCLVYLAERLQWAVCTLAENGFALKRVLPVQSRPGEAARLVLLEARKQGGEGCRLEAPLILYGGGQALSPQALAFCPFLACNAGPDRKSGEPEAARE